MPKQLKAHGRSAPPPSPDYAATTDSVKAAAAKILEQKAKLEASFKPKAGTKYIRNIRSIPVRVTLDTGRRIDLSPRGAIDDLTPVSKEEQADSKLIINVGLLFEVLTVKEAAEIIRKQAINAQAPRRNPLLDHLVNPKGEAYEIEDVHIDPTMEEQSITVARVQDAADGRNTTGNTELVREATGPQEVAVPGSRQNPLPTIPSDISAEEVREFIAWREARQLRESLGQAVIEETQTLDK